MTMNRLDARARLVFHYAREEADRLGHAVIESEHLLLGLLREGGTAAQVLNASGLTLEAARHRVVELIGRFERSRDAPPPAITALARRVMDLAGVEAANYQSSYINTGFVLLGMIHAGDGVAMGIINQTVGGTKAVRKATLAALQLPPDAGTDIEESSSSSSLSGIVAVPADSVLSRLFQRTPEPTSPIPVQPETSFISFKLDPVEPVDSQPRVEALAPRDEDIPDSMLIDEAFEEVPPEIEPATTEFAVSMVETPVQIPVVETMSQIVLTEAVPPIPEPEVVTSVAKQEMVTAEPELEAVIAPAPIEAAESPEFAGIYPTLKQEIVYPTPEPQKEILIAEVEPLPAVRHPTPVIDVEPNDLPKTLSEPAENPAPDELSAKVTAEVLVAEVEVMPETFLQPEKLGREPALTDSTDGLLISDILEAPFEQHTYLVSYQPPALTVLSEPQLTLEPPEYLNLSIEELKQPLESQELIEDKEMFPTEALEPNTPALEWLETENTTELIQSIQDFEPNFNALDSSISAELSVVDSGLQDKVEPPLIEIDESVMEFDNSMPIINEAIHMADAQPELEDATHMTSKLSFAAADSQSELDVVTQEVVLEIPNIESLPEAPIAQLDEQISSAPTLLKIASWDMVTASSVIKRQIIALGGGGFSEEGSNLLLDQYILEVASSAREVAVPRVCFVSTAAGDSDVYIKRFYKAFEQLNCQATHLPLFHTDDWAEDLEDMILGADVLYFSGGSTKNALALWQAWQLEPIFKQAYEAGTVFTGVSAGAICWFEQFTTDSLGRSLGVMNGLGWLPGSFTPHYDSERYRKPTLEKFLRAQKITPGFAADDNAALHFVNGEYTGAVASLPTAKAYHVTLGRNRLVESQLETRYLGEIKNHNS